MINRKGVLTKIYAACFVLFSVLYIGLTSLTALKIPTGFGFAVFLIFVIAFPPIVEALFYLIAKKKIKTSVEKSEYTIYALSPDTPFMDITTDEGLKRLYFTKEGKLIFCDPQKFSLLKKGNPEEPDRLICEIKHSEASGIFSGYISGDETKYTFICDLPEAKEVSREVNDEKTEEIEETTDEGIYVGVTPIGETQADYSNAFKNVEEYAQNDYPFPVRDNVDPFA